MKSLIFIIVLFLLVVSIFSIGFQQDEINKLKQVNFEQRKDLDYLKSIEEKLQEYKNVFVVGKDKYTLKEAIAAAEGKDRSVILIFSNINHTILGIKDGESLKIPKWNKIRIYVFEDKIKYKYSLLMPEGMEFQKGLGEYVR